MLTDGLYRALSPTNMTIVEYMNMVVDLYRSLDQIYSSLRLKRNRGWHHFQVLIFPRLGNNFCLFLTPVPCSTLMRQLVGPEMLVVQNSAALIEVEMETEHNCIVAVFCPLNAHQSFVVYHTFPAVVFCLLVGHCSTVYYRTSLVVPFWTHPVEQI